MRTAVSGGRKRNQPDQALRPTLLNVIRVTAGGTHPTNNPPEVAGELTMAKESLAGSYTAPILVLALGQANRGDEAFGPALLNELEQGYRYAGGFVEFMDGGVQGLQLLSSLAGREVIVILDALSGGRQPGEVAVLEGAEVLRYANGNSAVTHPGDAHELLSTAAFLGDLPPHFYVVGIEPGKVHQGPALSSAVRKGLQPAAAHAQEIIDHWLVELAEPVSA
jgi:hydrogenase maturation protease